MVGLKACQMVCVMARCWAKWMTVPQSVQVQVQQGVRQRLRQRV